MPQWLPLIVSLCALAAGVFALLRANRVDTAVRRAFARRGQTGQAQPAPPQPAPPQTGPQRQARPQAREPQLQPQPSPLPQALQMPQLQGGLSRVAVVRFDAFTDVGGRLSSAAALLDGAGNGIVITTMNGRDSNRTYLKQIREGVGTTALSPEEVEAVAQAVR